MDRPCLRTETGGKLDHRYLSPPRGLCLHGAGGAIRKLESAAFGDTDRADVSAGGRVRTAAAWHERRHSSSNRIRRSGCDGLEERELDRGIREAGPG